MKLQEFLENAEYEGFESKPFYSQEGDALSYFVKDVDFYADRLDSLVTVYLSEENNEIIGCKIKGVKRLLKILGDFGVEVTDGTVKLGLFFLASMSLSSPQDREKYQDLPSEMKTAPVDTTKMQTA